MKRLFFLLAFLFVLADSYSQCDSLPISVTIKVDSSYVKTYSKKGKFMKELIRRRGYVVKSDSLKESFYNVSITIRNLSDSVIAFSAMSCSWSDNFIVNNVYMYLRGEECDSNYPDRVELAPGESKVFPVTLTKSMEFDYKCQGCTGFPQVETTRLGLILFNDLFGRKPVINYFTGIEDKSLWRIAWSNPLYLLTDEEANPKPLEFGVYQKENNYN